MVFDGYVFMIYLLLKHVILQAVKGVLVMKPGLLSTTALVSETCYHQRSGTYLSLRTDEGSRKNMKVMIPMTALNNPFPIFK